MNPFAGKSATERNKIIAAMVLGVLALGALFFAFGGSIFSSAPKVTVSVSPTPKASATVPVNTRDLEMPSESDQVFGWTTTPVVYNGVPSGAEPGRNIFAFYEPPPPCGSASNPCPPTPIKTPPTPSPVPSPDIYIAGVNPQNVYAGSRGFRIEIVGERMLPNAKIYFSQNELPTTFVNETTMVAEVPANFISSEGPRQIIIQTPDGKKYSNAASLTVQAPPRPQFQYIGMIARRGANNDTAYFMETGRQTPISARLNDVVGGRFRLMSVSENETLFEDVNLGFKHKVPLFRPAPGTATAAPTRGGVPTVENYVPYSPATNFQVPPGQSIPGIPDNIPRYVPPAANRPPDKKDEDDDDVKP